MISPLFPQFDPTGHVAATGRRKIDVAITSIAVYESIYIAEGFEIVLRVGKIRLESVGKV